MALFLAPFLMFYIALALIISRYLTFTLSLATSNDRGFNGSTWVVKRYLEKAAVDIIASHRRGHSANISTTMGAYVRA